jgi:hypothetical protein
MDRKQYRREYMRKRRAGEKTAQDNGLDHLLIELEWKGIPGRPGYFASRCGQIKSEEREVLRSNGRTHKVPTTVLKQNKDSKGYYQVRLYVNKEKNTMRVHRLIFETFNRQLNPDEQIDHMDNNKTNNHIDNLQALTHSEHWPITQDRQYKSTYSKGYKAGYRKAVNQARDAAKNLGYTELAVALSEKITKEHL